MNLSTINLRHFRVFLAVVSSGSLATASKLLHITLSAVSKSLKELEQELGVQLLVRGRKGVQLTQAGEAFNKHAAQTMASFRLAMDDVQAVPQAPQVLKVGALPAAAGYMLAPVVAQMRERYPHVQVQVVSGLYDYLVGKLRTRELDLIVGRLIGRDMVGVSFEALYEEDLLLVVRHGHPLAQRERLTLEDLRPYVLLVSPQGSLVRISVDNFLLAQGNTEPFQIQESLSETFSRVYVHDYDGVWFVQRGVVDLDLRLGLVKQLPFTSPLLRAPIGLTSPTDRPMAEVAVQFAGLLRQWCSAQAVFQ
ncbi:LysR substrate-binding domain-containing protein [Pseudomonas sp. PSKL.D1]|uniref:LysR substrate-binding domain-containing protein n=1 Tax=Pseudomonas sp. PSKL.D1 TaxID=3029060 RepID=UPI0023815D01|nr:LysR substrate-binding domain-containing protein [Pseudomonas sp. PSKL.D1]WDY55908.1 LysR substrate-binding domain-containing protein [Pseudomonas sp. PSKL.D1]